MGTGLMLALVLAACNGSGDTKDQVTDVTEPPVTPVAEAAPDSRVDQPDPDDSIEPTEDDGEEAPTSNDPADFDVDAEVDLGELDELLAEVDQQLGEIGNGMSQSEGEFTP
ncbi:MAG: hypothetical protein ACE5KX_02685 [Acidimicrobiia bacterium]